MNLPTGKDSRPELRRGKESILSGDPVNIEALPEKDLDLLFHEIQVSRIELELQNAELIESRNALESNKERYKMLYNKYANLFDLSPNAYMVFDEAGTISEANLTAAIMFNAPKDKLIGQAVERFIHPDDQAALNLLIQDCRKSSNPCMAELKMGQSEGRCFPGKVQLQFLPQPNQAGNEFRAAIFDLSEQDRVDSTLDVLHECLEIAVRAVDGQQLLEAYVHQIKNFAKCKAVGIRLLDETGCIPYKAWDGFDRKFFDAENCLCINNDRGMCLEVINGRTWPDKPFFTEFGSFYMNETSRIMDARFMDEFNHGFNLCNSFGFESIALIPITIDQSISGLIHVADRRENMFPLRIVEVLEQVAMRLGLALQRFRMQERLSEAVHDQRELSLHLLKAKEEEQRRIALELHDQTGQDLNVLKLRLKEIERRLRKDQEAVKKLCTKTQLFTDHIIDNVRGMIHGLNPSTLEDLGLVAALKQMVREFSEHSEMRIETHLEPLGDIRNREEQVCLFRIVQEALNNVFKHAEANFIAIRSLRTDKGLQLFIEDNGRGFDPHPKNEAKGMGLAAMKLRAAMIGAKLSIQSQFGSGTRITISLYMDKSI